MKPLLHLFIGFSMCVLACHQAIAQDVPNEIVLYDNTMFEAKPPPGAPANAQPPWGTRGDTHFAQQFYTGEADNVSSVELTIKRTGNPGGRISFEIWDTGEDGFPGEMVGVLSEIEVNNLPIELETIAIPGVVAGLQPMTRYYFVYRNIDINFNASWNLDESTVGARTYHFPTLFEGLNGGPGPSSHPPEGAPLQEFIFLSDGQDTWSTLTYAVPLPPGYVHMRLAGAPSHTLTITPNSGGSVTADPDQPSYPAETEVTLTATPNEGYEFTKWLIDESESTDNPLTFTIEADTTITPVYEMVAPNEIIHYDTLANGHSNAGRPDRATQVALNLPGDKGARDSQAFIASGDKVTSVTLGLGRQGSPSEHLRIEIWDATASGNPSKSIGVLGEIEMNALTNYPSWPAAAPYLDDVTIEGMVSGLTPNMTYFLVIYYTVDNFNGPAFDWGYDTVDGPDDQAVKDMVVNPGNGWRRLATYFNQNFTYYLRARISGSIQSLSSYTLTIPPSDHGTATKRPDLPTYPEGTEFTLTATPNESFEFTKWLIGESESTDNPLTFTIEADTTITPEFAEIPATFTLTIPSSEGGTITADPELSNYPAGTVITLTATPNEGYALAGWGGDTTDEGNRSSITLTMNGDKNVTATFRPVIVPEIAEILFDPVARNVSLTWPSHPDAIYEIEVSADLVRWESLETKPGTGERTKAVLDATPNGERQRYYRLREKP